MIDEKQIQREGKPGQTDRLTSLRHSPPRPPFCDHTDPTGCSWRAFLSLGAGWRRFAWVPVFSMPLCISSLTSSLPPRPTLSIYLLVMDVDNGRTTAMVGIPSLPPTGTFAVPAHMTTTTIAPQQWKQKQATEDLSTTETINRICGFAYEDGGLSIASDDCGRWCHTTCSNIIEGAVPKE